MTRGTVGRTLAAVALGVCAQGTAFAQESGEAGPLGALPFNVDARATVSGGYTSNVFSTETNTKGDWITIVEPEIGLSRKGENFELAVGASAEIGSYFDLTSENYFDAALRGLARVEVLDDITVFAGGDFLWEHEPRTSADEARGVEPTTYTDATAYAGVSGKIDPFAFKLGVNYRDLNFDDVSVAGGGVVNNDDRDRTHVELGARLGYIFMPNTQAFVQFVHETRTYDAPFDDNGFDRDSTGWQVAIGVAGELGNLKGEVLVGGLFYDYDDAAFANVDTVDIGANLTWRPNDRTRLTGTVEREVDETTIAGSSSYVSTVAGARIDYWIAPDLSTFGYAFISQDDYQDVARIDYVAELGFGIRYFFTRNLFVGAEYGFENRNSDVADADYTSHQFLLSVGADLDPAWKGNPAMARAETSGFYVGVQAMDGALLTPVAGPRGAGGSLSADFGGFGQAGGAFAGYRVMVNDFLLGVEVEADAGDVEWTHSGNRTFSIRRNNSFGASALIGFAAMNDVLLYGRAGIASTAFDGTYLQGGAVGEISERETGLRFGLGAEFPIAGSLSGRMEYTYTNYGDLVLGAPRGGADDDIFNNAEVMARFGLVYRFGAVPASDPVPVDFSGAYAGAQVGHEVLATDNTGARPAALTPAFVLDATRAGEGFTGGVFVGYGQTFGDVYLGAEVDADIANTNWNIERDPTGRIYSVEKLGSVGASVRAGYVLNDSVLVYLRGGVVGSRFENEYTVGGGTVATSETKAGLRFGGGVEFGVSDETRVRLDYTRTFYSDYSVTYPSGSDRFDPSENLFRIGVIVDF